MESVVWGGGCCDGGADMKRQWIKLYVEMLDDPKIGILSIDLKWRFVELLLVAAEGDGSGALPPVTQLAWRLRVNEDDLIESLRALNASGVVQQQMDIWKITSFEERQYSEAYERVKRFRNAKSNANVTESNAESNAEVAEKESPSTSTSYSSSEGEGAGEGVFIPKNPRQAKANPDIQIYENISGCFPGQRDYVTVIETIQYLRGEHGEKIDDYLKPFWMAWSTRKNKDGKPYRKSSLVWLCEWAMSGDIPKANGTEPKPNWSPVPGVEETRRMLEDKEKLHGKNIVHDGIKALTKKKQAQVMK